MICQQKKTLNFPGKIPKLPCFKATPSTTFELSKHTQNANTSQGVGHIFHLSCTVDNRWLALHPLLTIFVSNWCKWSCSPQHFVYHQKLTIFEHIPTAMNQSSIPENTELPRLCAPSELLWFCCAKLASPGRVRTSQSGSTLPETIGLPKRKGSSPNHYFSGAILVLGSVLPQKNVMTVMQPWLLTKAFGDLEGQKHHCYWCHAQTVSLGKPHLRRSPLALAETSVNP